jgi:hypothetical protein
MDGGDSLVFVCSMCGQLGLLNVNTWSSMANAASSEPSPSALPPASGRVTTDLSTWRDFHHFSVMTDLTRDDHVPPLLFQIPTVAAFVLITHTVVNRVPLFSIVRLF